MQGLGRLLRAAEHPVRLLGEIDLVVRAGDPGQLPDLLLQFRQDGGRVCPQPLEEGQEDWEGNVDGYCGYAQSRAHRVRKVRSWLAGRELDFRTYSLVAKPTGPVPYSQELATSVFDTGDTGLDEGMNEESTHIEDPLDMDVTIGDIDTIPKNEVVPTSDFDDKGSAIHRRSAKRGYTAKLWAFLDYNCENGFKFKEDD